MASEESKQSTKQRFISIIEQKIISGEFAIDQKLPPERELAEMAGVSRMTVHAGLLEMATRNVLRIVPRQGTYVNNFQTDGRLELFGALLQDTDEMERGIFESLFDFREIIETAAAERAARYRTEENVTKMRCVIEQEHKTREPDKAALLDYQLHLQVAMASGNLVLPMTLRSIERMYISFATKFYSMLDDYSVIYVLHERMTDAIEKGDTAAARVEMKVMLDHGKNLMRKRIRAK